MANTKVICISGKAGHGKDMAGKFIKECMESYGKIVVIAHYADLVKYICKTFFHWDGVKDDYGRSLLQKVGTEIVRAENPNYWVDFLISILSMFGGEWDYMIIPDWRYPNEAERFLEVGVETTRIRVVRPDYESSLTPEQQSHSSETVLDSYDKFDYTISATDQMQLLMKCAEVVTSLLKGESK